MCTVAPSPQKKIAVHGLLRLLNAHVVIELTSVKKGLSPFPFFFVGPNKVTLRLQTWSLNEM